MVSCIRCEVWNERRRAAEALLWAREVVGPARAALRSAEGMREAMVSFCLWMLRWVDLVYVGE
jgi:hypothetical protein